MSMNELRQVAGWYADPQNPNAERWWNGSQWTSHTRAADLPWDSTGLEGHPPTAWSATDSPLATVAQLPPDSTGMFAPAAELPVAQSLNIPAGWFPDPTGLPAQRWWDGQQWSDRTAPLLDRQSPWGAAGTGALPVPPPYYGPTVVMVSRPKSVGVAFLLTFLFGPLGMFYSTVRGAMIMLGVLFLGGFVAGVVTLGLAWLVWWPLVWVGSIVWGCIAAGEAPTAQVVHNGPIQPGGYPYYPPRY